MINVRCVCGYDEFRPGQPGQVICNGCGSPYVVLTPWREKQKPDSHSNTDGPSEILEIDACLTAEFIRTRALSVELREEARITHDPADEDAATGEEGINGGISFAIDVVRSSSLRKQLMDRVPDDQLSINGCFHRLWTRDVGTPGYDKTQWQALETHVHNFMRGLTLQPSDLLLLATPLRDRDVLLGRDDALWSRFRNLVDPWVVSVVKAPAEHR